MDFKKKSLKLKKTAAEFGHEIKLTHCQEILARIEGHSSRHSALLENKNKKNIPLPLETDDYLFIQGVIYDSFEPLKKELIIEDYSIEELKVAILKLINHKIENAISSLNRAVDNSDVSDREIKLSNLDNHDWETDIASFLIDELSPNHNNSDKAFYYMINVFYSVGDGFSVVVETDKDMKFDDDEVVEIAFKKNLLTSEDCGQVIGVEEIEKETYLSYSSNYEKKETCPKCSSKSFKDLGNKTLPRYECNNCNSKFDSFDEKNETLFPKDLKVFGYISTTDDTFHWEKTDITKEIELEILNNTGSIETVIDQGEFGASEVTDILFDNFNSKRIQDVKEFMSISNKHKEDPIGFSFYIDEDQLINWYQEYKKINNL